MACLAGGGEVRYSEFTALRWCPELFSTLLQRCANSQGGAALIFALLRGPATLGGGLRIRVSGVAAEKCRTYQCTREAPN